MILEVLTVVFLALAGLSAFVDKPPRVGGFFCLVAGTVCLAIKVFHGGF